MLPFGENLLFTAMTVTVKNKSGLTVPAEIKRQARLKIGDLLEFRVSGGVITILRKLPEANDEYTPEQRRIIDAQLAEGLDDIAKGRISPRFNTVDEMLASLKSSHKPPGKPTPLRKKPRAR